MLLGGPFSTGDAILADALLGAERSAAVGGASAIGALSVRLKHATRGRHPKRNSLSVVSGNV